MRPAERLLRLVHRIRLRRSPTARFHAAWIEALRRAAETRHLVHLRYRDLREQVSERHVRPLGCDCAGGVWTLAAWCELRQGFQAFRIDRIEALDVLPARFHDEPGRTLADFFRSAEAEMTARDSATDA